MNVLLIYATNSGSTYLTANIIKETLEFHNHSVTQKEASKVMLKDMEQAQLILIGSPSWKVNGKQGMPHENILNLIDKVPEQLKNKKCALFGCGDSSYTFFCGAVDQLEKFVADNGGTQVMPSLRIDGFFFDLNDTQEQAFAWSTVLADIIN